MIVLICIVVSFVLFCQATTSNTEREQRDSNKHLSAHTALRCVPAWVLNRIYQRKALALPWQRHLRGA